MRGEVCPEVAKPPHSSIARGSALTDRSVARCFKRSNAKLR